MKEVKEKHMMGKKEKQERERGMQGVRDRARAFSFKATLHVNQSVQE